MLAQVKKLAGGDLAGRFGAWWSGRDYTAPEAAEGGEAAEAAAAPPAKPVVVADAPKAPASAVVEAEPVPVEAPKAKAPSRNQAANGTAIRIRALETLWGEGRLAPGSFSLDTKLVDAAVELANGPGDIGFIGGDGALLNVFAGQSGRQALVSEWRRDCAEYLTTAAPRATVTAGEVDRPRGFVDGSLPAVISVEAFAFADHKAGMVGRVFRALDAGGRWVFLDTNLAHVLEQAASNGLTGREGALFLQELAWEAQSWRARTRAIEGGALEVNIWVADKTAQTGPLLIALDRLVGADDAGAADALFDRS
ncbi:MAG: hypothetical protein B7Z38_01010 [Rhodobacterales bacterium 12-64-8]|nr:MAG: hypothetical protein B7Z38_01010 [Rhodobacterales bacterium 12-64-8]